MSSKWHFRKMRPADIASDPGFARAFFSQGARSLVRESIQNSLDAKESENVPVTVRFTVRSGNRAAHAHAVAPFVDGLWEHIHSVTSGLERAPGPREPIPFLAVEDFGTRGLTGDPEGWDPFDSRKNSFFLFFRALGRSGKENEDRGRWGVGKFVFPFASRAHCLLGYTIPTDTRQHLLMGRTVLKMHKASNASYHPDGQWGVRDDDDALVLPETQSDTIDEFRRIFGLHRSTESGLSVVVPWLSVSLDGPSIIEAVVAEYFLPVLRSELLVDVDDNGCMTRIDAETIVHLGEQTDSAELRARIALAIEAATWPSDRLVVLPVVDPSGDTNWGALISDEGKKNLLKELDELNPVAVRVPINVRPKDGASVRSYFDVFLQQTDTVGRSRPLIVREGITISDEKTQHIQNHIALVVIDDAALAGFVGDAETPAHTSLQRDLVAEKYVLSGKMIKVLQAAAAGLLSCLEQVADNDDVSLLADLFPIQHDDEPGRQGRPRPGGVGPMTPPVPPIPAATPRYRVTRTDAGFQVKGTENADLPASLTIRFAYEVRRGNPLKRYNPLDFSLLRRDLKFSSKGVTVLDKSHNSLVVRPDATGFQIDISGFDPRRDLIVRVDAQSGGAVE